MAGQAVPSIEPDDLQFEVPEGWRWAPLAEVCVTQTGATPKAASGEPVGDSIAYVRPANFVGLGPYFYGAGAKLWVKCGTLRARHGFDEVVCG